MKKNFFRFFSFIQSAIVITISMIFNRSLKMNATDNKALTGIHAGSLWNIKPGGALYFVNDHGNFSPFENPKFKEAFNKATAIAVPFFTEKRTLADQDLVNELSEKICKHFSPDEIEKHNQEMENLINTLPLHPFVEKINNKLLYKNNNEKFTSLFFNLLLRLIVSSKEIPTTEALIQSALDSKKKIISFYSESELKNNLISTFSDIFELEGFAAFFMLMVSKEYFHFFADYLKERGNGWDFGSEYEGVLKDNEILTQKLAIIFRGIPYELLKKALSILEKANSQMVAGKIDQILKQEENPLFILNDGTDKEKTLFSELIDKKIELVGPLREAMNPRGFLFEIKKADKIVGYHLGSVHVTPEWILENFNSEILKAFEFCDTLGVELDITRDDVLKVAEEINADYPESVQDLLVAITRMRLNDLGIHFHAEDDDEFIKKGNDLYIKTLNQKFGIESGIDLAFIEKAKERKIPIVDLETIESHVKHTKQEALFNIKELEELQKEVDAGGKENIDLKLRILSKLEKKLQEYKEKYIKSVLHFFPEILEIGYLPALEAFYNKMDEELKQDCARRNMEIALKTDKLIRNKKIPFSIEGAFHLVGRLSVPEIMRTLGYTVTQVICDEPRNKPIQLK